MIINAYAKINLTLDITGVRPDGFHSLRSVMVPVTLCDKVDISSSDSFAFNCNIKQLETSDNLCVRAANAFFAKTGLPNAVSVTLEKRVPFPAGLGGGSSDAAAVLKGLNAFFKNPLSTQTLFEIAATLGSDVPFCLLGTPALCEGRGELLTPISGLNTLILVIAIGKGRLSTPEVYKRYDAANLPVRDDTSAFIQAVSENDNSAIISSLGNAFEPVTDILCPETKHLRTLMLSLGALSSHLSGSGPSVYGVFKNASDANSAAKALQDEGFSAYVCQTLK